MRATPEYEENFTFKPSEQQLSASIISNQSSQLELEAGLEKPNDAKDVTPLANITKASVPFNYDAHTKSGLVLQTGTEATSQVGQFDSNQQLTNSILLHEPPSHWGHDLPSTQPHEVPTAQQQDDTRKTTQEQLNPVNNVMTVLWSSEIKQYSWIHLLNSLMTKLTN